MEKTDEVKDNEKTPGEVIQTPPILEKLKTEKDNWRNKAQGLEVELNKFKEEQMKSQNQYKELADFHKSRADGLEAEKTAYEQEKLKGAKMNAAVAEMEKLGLKRERREAALRLIAPDMDKLKYDPDTGFILGAEHVAKAAKELSPELFGGGNTSIPNQQAPGQREGTMTPEQFKALSPAEQAKIPIETAYKIWGLR